MVLCVFPTFPVTVSATELYSEMDLTNISEKTSVYSLINDRLKNALPDDDSAVGMNKDANSNNIDVLNNAQLSLTEDKNMLYYDGEVFGNPEKSGLCKYEIVPGENGESAYLGFRKIANFVNFSSPPKPYNWQVTMDYKFDRAVEDIFSDNAGVYTFEYTLRINKFGVNRGDGRGIYLSTGNWPYLTQIILFADKITDGNQNILCDFSINDGDVVNVKMECDTTAKTNQITVSNGTQQETVNLGLSQSVNNISFMSVMTYESVPIDTSFDILGMRMYKDLSSPTVSDLSTTGELTEGKTVTLNYDFHDGSRERLSEINWYTTDDENGEDNLTTVHTDYYSAGDSTDVRQYVIKSEDVGKYLVAEVTPNSFASRPIGESVGVESGTPQKIVAGKVISKADAPKYKLGDVREIDGKKYYQVYDISEMESGAETSVLTDKTGSAYAEFKDGAYVQTVSSDGDSIKTTARLFGLNEVYKDITANEYLIEMEVNVNNASNEVFEIDMLDGNARSITSAGIKAGAVKDEFYVDYTNEDGDADRKTENYGQGNVKTILFKLNKADKTITCLTDGLGLINNEETISDITSLFAVRFGLTSGTGTAEISRLNILIPADEVMEAAFESSMDSLGFSTDRENFIKGDIQLPVKGYIGTDFKWTSSDESVISNTGVVGYFAERKRATLTAELYSESLENAGITSSMTKSYNFLLEALAVTQTDLLDDAYITASVNAGKSGYVHDSDSSGNRDLTTAWTSSESVESYVQFDLKSVKPFNSYMLTGNNLGEYRFEISADGKTYTETKLLTATETAATAKTTETVVSARYIRMVFPQGTAAEVADISIYFNPTAADIIKLDFDNLNVDIPYVVTGDLVLPIRGERGSTVTWKSGNAEILSNDGTILSRPAGDTIVLLTYTVSSPTDSEIPGKSNTLRIVIQGKGTSGGSSGGGGGGTSSKGNKVNTSVSLNPGAGYVPSTTTETFNDLNNAEWARNYILDLYNNKIISGYPDGSFKPNNLVAREEFVQMIGNAFDFQNAAEINFADVPADSYYYDNLKKALASGIILGIDDKNFGTGENLTRQDLAVIAYRILTHYGVESDNAAIDFTDSGDISDYATDAVSHLKAAGILNGDASNRFNPKEGATRAEIAKVVYMLKHYITERTNG